jgi:hypothetical protein
LQQSNAIFAGLFVAFLFFITARGELRKYMGFLLSTPNQSGNLLTSIIGGAAAAATSSGGTPGTAIQGAQGPTSYGGAAGPMPLV